METKVFRDQFTRLLKKNEFKKEGSLWIRPKQNGLSDMVYLLRSSFGEDYYLETGKWLHAIHGSKPLLARNTWDLNARADEFYRYPIDPFQLNEDFEDEERMRLISELLDHVDRQFWSRFTSEAEVLEYARNFKSGVPRVGPALRKFIQES